EWAQILDGETWPPFGDYPAALDLQGTVIWNSQTMDEAHKLYWVRWSEMSSILEFVAQNHTAAQGSIEEILRRALSPEEAQDWISKDPDALEEEHLPTEGQILHLFDVSLRQRTTDRSWDDGYGDIYAMVHGLRPDEMQAFGQKFYDAAHRVQES